MTIPASESTASSTYTGISTRDRERDRVRGTGGHGRAVVERELAEEGALAKVDDTDLGDRPAERGDDVAEQVVGERPGRADALLVHRDSCGFCAADQDGQAARTVDLSQHQNRLLSGHLDPHADDPHLDHHGAPFSSFGNATRRNRARIGMPAARSRRCRDRARAGETRERGR